MPWDCFRTHSWVMMGFSLDVLGPPYSTTVDYDYDYFRILVLLLLPTMIDG